MHRLAYLATLHNECRLHTLADTNQVVMHCTHGQERRDVETSLLPLRRRRYFNLIGQYDVVHTLVYARLGILTQFVKRTEQPLPSF